MRVIFATLVTQSLLSFWGLAFSLASEAATTSTEFSEPPPIACQKLVTLNLPDAQIVDTAIEQHTETAQQRCKVTIRIWPAQLSSSATSFVDVYLWLPAIENWNGRLLALGNGGYSPQLPLSQMTRYLNEGFAVAATDTGHKTETLDFVIAANERIDYWGRLAVQLLGHYAKEVLQAYYQQPARFSYFAGCSTGGHQALTAAQYYPTLFDGILAGAPGHNRVALNAAFLWLFQQSHNQQGEQVLTKADLALLQQQVLAQCDARDGQRDGILSDPAQCQIDFAAFTCSETAATDCLSRDKITRIQALYAGPYDPVSQQQIYPGFLPGTEFVDQHGWSSYWHDAADAKQPARADFWRYWVFPERSWQPWQFDWHKDMLAAKAHLSARIDATKTDLSEFIQHGGKLLLFHGLADPVVSATDTLNYTTAVFTDTPLQTEDIAAAVQLYLIPGMAHCAGGSGVNQLDALPTLIQWVEQQQLPASLSGSRIEQEKTLYQQTLYPTVITPSH